MALRRVAALATAGLTVLAAAIFTQPSTAGAAASSGWMPTAGVKFNVPRSTPAREYNLEGQVIGAINHARAGSTIEMVMFSFDRIPVAQALIKAHRQRHVHVQVIVNDHEFPHAQQMLKKALGTNRQQPSFWFQCKSSCRGQGDVQHSKFILFSHTGAARDVVMLGSLNMKVNGAVNQFNDLLTIDGNTKLYTALDQVYQQMKLDRLADPAYLVEKIDSIYTLYVLPFPRPPYSTAATKYTAARDPIIKILDPVKCTGANTPSGRTVIRVNMHAWADARGVMLAKRFEQLYKQGCDVQVAIGFAGHEVRRIFGQHTSRGVMPHRSTGYDTNDDGIIDLYSHEKMLLIDGHYGTATHQKIVVTGSSNYQNGGQYGDEIILEAKRAGLYDSYAKNWNWVWANHTHGFSNATLGSNDG